MKNFKLLPGNQDLSDCPGEAILECLKDLGLCDKHPDYRIEMRSWHRRVKNSFVKGFKCSVCLGGARPARIYNNPALNLDIIDILKMSWKEHGKIISMDNFRIGRFFNGLETFYQGFDRDYFQKPITKERSDILIDLEDNWIPFYSKEEDVTGSAFGQWKENLIVAANILRA